MEQAEVQRRLDRASIFVQQGNCEAAIREFEVIDPYFRAHGDLPAFRWNYAHCLAEAKRPLAALESLRLMQKLVLPAQTREAVEVRIGELRGKDIGGLRLTCKPAGSTVEIDGVLDLPMPCPVEIPDMRAGTHTLRVLSPGDVLTTVRQRIPPGRPTELAVVVAPELIVLSPVEGSYVQVDGRYAGTAGPGRALALRTIEPGRREIRVTSPTGGKPWITKVRLTVGQRTQVEAVVDGRRFTPSGAVVSAEDDDDTLMWVGIGAGAVAVAGVAIGAVLLFGQEEPAPVQVIDLTIGR